MKNISVKKGCGIVSSAFNQALKIIPVSTVVNRAIDALPFELHLPGGYKYCGPGTRLQERLRRGDKGINPLDEACKVHDIVYSQYSDSNRRSIADKELAERAWQRVTSSDATLGERAASLAVTAAMKAKTAVGGGRRREKRQSKKSKRKVTRRRAVKKKTHTRKTSKNGRGLYLRPYQNAR